VIETVVVTARLAGIFLVATGISSLLSSRLYPAFRRVIAGFRPDTRSLATLCFALIAPGIGFLTVAFYLAPAHAQPLVFQHCHGDLCGSHAPVIAADSFGGLGLLAVSVFIVSGFMAAATRVLFLGRRRLALLFALSRPLQKHLIVDSDRVFAWCCGLIRQRIVLSSALVGRLNNEQLELILAHERAHAARFDNLRNLTARWVTRFWPRKQGNRLCADLEADGERACDSAAIRAVPDPALFRQVVDVMAAEPVAAHSGAQVRFGSTSAAERLRAASAGDGLHPWLAYLFVAAVWSVQFALVIAVSHPVVEGLAALGG